MVSDWPYHHWCSLNLNVYSIARSNRFSGLRAHLWLYNIGIKSNPFARSYRAPENPECNLPNLTLSVSAYKAYIYIYLWCNAHLNICWSIRKHTHTHRHTQHTLHCGSCGSCDGGSYMQKGNGQETHVIRLNTWNLFVPKTCSIVRARAGRWWPVRDIYIYAVGRAKFVVGILEGALLRLGRCSCLWVFVRCRQVFLDGQDAFAYGRRGKYVFIMIKGEKRWSSLWIIYILWELGFLLTNWILKNGFE